MTNEEIAREAAKDWQHRHTNKYASSSKPLWKIILDAIKRAQGEDKEILDWVEFSRAKVEPYVETGGCGVFRRDGKDFYASPRNFLGSVRGAINAARKQP
jgi:hypothetical protein